MSLEDYFLGVDVSYDSEARTHVLGHRRKFSPHDLGECLDSLPWSVVDGCRGRVITMSSVSTRGLPSTSRPDPIFTPPRTSPTASEARVGEEKESWSGYSSEDVVGIPYHNFLRGTILTYTTDSSRFHQSNIHTRQIHWTWCLLTTHKTWGFIDSLIHLINLLKRSYI